MKHLFKSIISLFCLSVFLIFAIASSESDETTEEAESKLSENVIEVSASTLLEEIDANEVKFMNNYKDKTLEVTGSINNFDTGFDDESVIITLSGGESWSSVRCALAKDQNKKAEEYSKGDLITIKGLCTGESLGDPQMKSCIIVK